jgi:hypothetical protein
VEPYKYIGRASIKGQCQHDYFYGKDSRLDELLQISEAETAPVLYDLNRELDCDSASLGPLILLCVQLNNRTRKSAEEAKLPSKNIAKWVLNHAIKSGRLPAPPEPLTEDLIDFPGMPQVLAQSTIHLLLEMLTLECKLLCPCPGGFFLTSDNPTVVLNEFGHRANKHRPCVGFGQSGFQMLVPLGPNLAFCFYDPAVYKVGNRQERFVALSALDTEILNGLQVQSADKCIYCHRLDVEHVIYSLVQKYGPLRIPISKSLVEIPGPRPGETILWTRTIHPNLPVRWSFMKFLRHTNARPGQRRNPQWTEAILKVMEDIKATPNGPDVWTRLDNYFGANTQGQPPSASGPYAKWFRRKE